MPRHDARAALARNRSTPSLLKPSRLMSASASGSRKRRGFGLPGCGRGVTVPHSMKPKPSAARPSMCAAFLSRPAASPTRLGNCEPHRRDRRRRRARRERLHDPEARRDVEARERHVVRGLGIEREEQRAEERVDHCAAARSTQRGDRATAPPSRSDRASGAMIPFARRIHPADPVSRRLRLAPCARSASLALASPAPARPPADAKPAGYAAREDVRAFIDEMAAEHGFDRAALARTFGQARYQRAIVAAMDRPLLEPPKWHDYARSFLAPERVAAGVAYWSAHAGRSRARRGALRRAARRSSSRSSASRRSTAGMPATTACSTRWRRSPSTIRAAPRSFAAS